MALTKKRVGLMVALIVVALSGLLAVQGVLMRAAWETKEQAFRRSVFSALDMAVRKLELGEAVSESARLMHPPAKPNWRGVEVIAVTQPSRRGETGRIGSVIGLCDTLPKPPLELKGDSLFYTVSTPQHIRIQSFTSETGDSQIVVDEFRKPGRYGIGVCDMTGRSLDRIYRFESDTALFVFRPAATPQSGQSITVMMPDREKEALVQRVLSQMLAVELKSIDQRIDSLGLDSAVASALQAQGIDLDYGYGVITGGNDSVALAVPASYRPELRASEFRTRLFPQDLLSRPADLALFFPARQAYLWKQMGPMLAAVSLFMAVIVFCFAYAVRVIMRQRQFAARMTDFINNMTHEFKTPIATVALVSEAISRSEVLADPERLSRFNRMIQDEMTRMRTQVDKILQMAVLEEGDYDLSLTDVDVHAAIAKAVENAALHVAGRGGSISCELNAEQTIVLADRLHIVNIIHNLLDNANKYSPDAPTITIMTRNVPSGIEVSVKDRGIGIAESDQKAVFDKYYRVTNGNVHDVKGFGLGLSYVKLMVTAHGGSIELQSAAGIGTEVRVFLPFEGPKESSR